MGSFLRVDGKFYSVMTKIFDMMFGTVLWLLGSLPIITILPSTASFYQVIVKCVRYEAGSVWETYWDAYRKNVKQGIGLTLLAGTAALVLINMDLWLFYQETDGSVWMLGMKTVALLLTVLYLTNLIWLVPVFSRFSNTVLYILRLTFVISIHFILQSVALFLLTAAAVIGVLTSIELVIFLPAVLLLVVSYLSEPVLRRYMPPQETPGDWRYGF